MALGKQFENTYWQNSSGELRASRVSDNGKRAELVPAEEAVDRQLQGMLFDPYTATGLREDPLLAEGQREDVARSALGMQKSDMPDYLQAMRKDSGSRPAPSAKAAREHQDLAVDALVSSQMPIHEMQDAVEHGNARTIVRPTPGRAEYDSELGRIRMNRQPVWGSDASGQQEYELDGGSQTLVHEMGHAKDRQRLQNDTYSHTLIHKRIKGSSRYREEYINDSDSLSEGVADGYADRYAPANPMRLQSYIEDPQFAEDVYPASGYSTKYSGFKTNTQRALYAATRAHVGMTGDLDDVVNRRELLNVPELNLRERRKAVERPTKGDYKVMNAISREKSAVMNRAALGQMWDNSPHVRDHLTRLNLHKEAMEASQENQKQRDEWTKRNVGEQLRMDI